MPTVYTIHNLAHQGQTSAKILDYLGIWTHKLVEESVGTVNFMARGIYHAGIVNTVSPTYAQEIMTRSGGANLDGLLRHRSGDLHGILNGIDVDVWHPATDKRLVQNYDATTLADRIQNKRALQKMAGLPVQDNVPLLGIVSRLDYQKGIDILDHALHLLANDFAGNAQFVVLGTGASEYEQMFANYARRFPTKISAILEYNAGIAPLIYAGSDMFLMPSRFEPCGLGQLIAMQYGCVPIVRATGGLVDTVWDGITGFSFHGLDSGSLWHAMQRAITVYNSSPTDWQQIQQNGMSQDFSWDRAAKQYQQLYEWAQSK